MYCLPNEEYDKLVARLIADDDVTVLDEPVDSIDHVRVSEPISNVDKDKTTEPQLKNHLLLSSFYFILFKAATNKAETNKAETNKAGTKQEQSRNKQSRNE